MPKRCHKGFVCLCHVTFKAVGADTVGFCSEPLSLLYEFCFPPQCLYEQESGSGPSTCFRGLTSRLLQPGYLHSPTPLAVAVGCRTAYLYSGAPRQNCAGTSLGNAPLLGFLPFLVTPEYEYSHLTFGEIESRSYLPHCTWWQVAGPRCVWLQRVS